MAIIAEWLESVAGIEKIIAVVIGRYDRDEQSTFSVAPIGKVLSWNDARPFLNYEFCNGVGSPDCHRVYAWTATRVLFASEYDGSTRLASVPRNPVECLPEFDGYIDDE